MTKKSEAIRHCSTTVWWLSVSCFKGFCSGASATEANFALTVFALRIQRGCQSTGGKLVGTALCMAHMVLWAGILPLMGIQIMARTSHPYVIASHSWWNNNWRWSTMLKAGACPSGEGDPGKSPIFPARLPAVSLQVCLLKVGQSKATWWLNQPKHLPQRRWWKFFTSLSPRHLGSEAVNASERHLRGTPHLSPMGSSGCSWQSSGQRHPSTLAPGDGNWVTSGGVWTWTWKSWDIWMV